MSQSEKNLTAVFTDTANAIRAKKQSVEEISPLDFADEVASIETGITPTGTKTITSNGIHDVTNYASADVQVEGYVPETWGLYWATGDWGSGEGEWYQLELNDDQYYYYKYMSGSTYGDIGPFMEYHLSDGLYQVGPDGIFTPEEGAYRIDEYGVSQPFETGLYYCEYNKLSGQHYGVLDPFQVAGIFGYHYGAGSGSDVLQDLSSDLPIDGSTEITLNDGKSYTITRTA